MDFNSQIMNSPCFVEKGAINDVYSPLLLNSEGMAFNKIKQSEDFIKDDSRCAWLVGYVKKNIDATDLNNVNPISYTSPSASANIPAAGSYAWEPCIQYIDSTGTAVNNSPKNCFYFYNSDISFRLWYQPNYISFFVGNVRYKFTENFQYIYSSTDYPNDNWGKITSCAFDAPSNAKFSDAEALKIAKAVFTTTRDNEDVRSKFETMVATGKYNQFNADTTLITEDVSKYNGKLIIKDNKVYKLEINPGQNKTFTQYFTGNDSTAVSWMTSVASKVQNCAYNTDNPSKNKIQIDFRGKEYQIVAREVPLNQTVSFNFPVSSSRNECVDATYDMFAMPVDPRAFGLTTEQNDQIVIKYTQNTETKIADLSAISETQLILATKLCTKLGANSSASLVYDLQLLPYCPFEDLDVYYENHIYGPTYGKYVIDSDAFTSSDCTLIWDNENTPGLQGIIFYPKHCNFSTTINYVIPNETVHYEWLTVENPTLHAQGTRDGLPQYRFADFQFKVTDGTWDIGPNSNNTDDNLELSDGLTKEECDYISLSVSPGLQSPQLYLTSTEFPTPPTGQEYTYTFQGSFTIKVLAHWILPDRPEDVKVKNECDAYRLASPNFNSMYEFKKTKLRDGLVSFNIDCTYKPFTPYIKLNPNYDNSFYASQDFNDSMGLICSGDFSIPMLSDAWINYELQNRNYQAIFNRQIQNLDVNQQIAKEQQQWQGALGAITATVGGGASGAMAGAKAGPYGAIAGGAMGTFAGAALGIAGYQKDKDWLDRQLEEQRSFAIDNFNYQLGNTQALNPTITKGTPLTYNNKVWPILELYSCTDEEKEILRSKIKFDGMTIMAVGTLRNYTASGAHLKGKMIRIENLDDDSHIAQAIYEEVDKGFYEGV